MSIPFLDQLLGVCVCFGIVSLCVHVWLKGEEGGGGCDECE